MNRGQEIKFRVWDKKNKELYYDNERFFIHPNGTLGDWGDLEEFQPQDEFVIQCWTGLTDENGRDIYEGDIIKERHFLDWDDVEGFEYTGVVRHKIYYNNGEQFSGFASFSNSEENNYAGSKIKMACRVVGNIFENPKLLSQ